MFPLVGCEGPESVRLARTSQEGGNAPAIDTAGARYACPLPYLFLTLVIALTLTTSACAAFRATDPAGPRTDVRLYPVGLADPAARLEEASLAWYQISQDRKSTRLNSSHSQISYAVFCLKKKT